MSQLRTEDFLARAASRARVVSTEWAQAWRQALGRAGLADTTTARDTLVHVAGGGSAGLVAQFRAQGLVLLWVAAALVVRYLLGATNVTATFLAYPAVVAFAAWHGGWTSGLVATLASAVAIRILGQPTPWEMVFFLTESLVIAGIVRSVTEHLRERTSTLELANRELGELQRADQRARSRDVSVRALEALTTEYAIVLLDRQGAIVEWRLGAQRLYGFKPEVVRGRSASFLFPDGESDASCRAMFAEAARDITVRQTVWQRRADGNYFEADVELARTTTQGGDGFAMVVRDRTLERQRHVSAEAAAQAQRVLRDEADVAHRQLAALQSVTDPSLNEWAPPHLVSELLERLRGVIHADGIALVLMRGVGAPRVYATPGGLHPGGISERATLDLSGHAMSRVVFVQNDRARVAEQSSLRWPEGTASLIAVPVVHAGEVEGTIEVVDCRGRRSTEWEIALMQVVAARVAGLARDSGDRRYVDSAPAAESELRAQRTA